MTSKWTTTLLFATSVSAAACDAQHDLDYPGQAVWTLLGSIVTDDARIDDETSAAIYWSNVGGKLDMLEQVDVEGNFPAEFTLRAFEPPPGSAQMSLEEVGIAPVDIAVGLVVAVDTPSAPFYPLVARNYPEAMVTLGPGETLIENDDRAWLRGGAPGHLVAYLSADPPEGAACLAGYTAGYNLVELRPKTSDEVASNEACEQTAREGALQAYNATRGTQVTEDDLVDDEAAQLIVDRLSAQFECASNCDLFRQKASVVAPGSRVTLEMEANPELVDWF